MLVRPTTEKKFMQGCATFQLGLTQPNAHPGAVRYVVTVKSLPVHSAEIGERGWEASSPPLQHCAAPERVTTRRHLHYSAGGGDAEDILHVARGEGVNGLGGSELEEGGTDAFYVAGWAIVALFIFTTTEISLL